MADPEKPNWGNRIILLVFGVLAIVTIGATIFATTMEWDAGDVAPDAPRTQAPLTDIEDTAPEAMQ